MQQQDSLEFVNKIFDYIEKGLEPSVCKPLLDSIFGGNTCSAMICTGCGFRRFKEDKIFNLSLEVKNMNNLY